MTLAIMQAAIKMVKAAIMAVREADTAANTERPAPAMPKQVVQL